jgi:hypothetical protein
MAEGDFEVHPLGTTEELRVLREFVKEISREVNAADCGSELKSMIAMVLFGLSRRRSISRRV